VTIDSIQGLTLRTGTLLAGATYLSDPIWIPRGCSFVSAEIQAEPTAAGTPTLVLKIRQAVTNTAATLPDRGVTSPAALVAFGPAEVVTFTTDGVVGNYVQFEVACTVANAEVALYVVAR
jgi:hypothetical protein